MAAPRIIFVTGKGGVGKTTVAAALGQRAAELGVRTLIVETANDGSLSTLFGHRKLSAAPQHMQRGLDAVCVDSRKLVESYFTRLLRFQWLADMLLSSNTFNALTAAAPGITEFLLLEKILDWTEPGFVSRHKAYGLVVVDGPATGHAVKLLRTPQNIAAMVPGGPIGKTADRLKALLADRERTQVVLVSLPEDMSVRETIETHRVLAQELKMPLTRPVINRVFPRHFTAAEAATISAYQTQSAEVETLLAAARFAIGNRREAERHVATLRRAVGASPILVRQLFTTHVRAEELRVFGHTLGRAVLGDLEYED